MTARVIAFAVDSALFDLMCVLDGVRSVNPRPGVRQRFWLHAELEGRRRVAVVGRVQQRAWSAEDGSARSVVEVVAEEMGPSLRWATATTTKTTRS